MANSVTTVLNHPDWNHKSVCTGRHKNIDPNGEVKRLAWKLHMFHLLLVFHEALLSPFDDLLLGPALAIGAFPWVEEELSIELSVGVGRLLDKDLEGDPTLSPSVPGPPVISIFSDGPLRGEHTKRG